MTEEVIDLTAARQAQADTSHQPLVVKIGGKEFSIPRPITHRALFAFADRDRRGMIDGVFGNQAQAAIAAGLDDDYLVEVYDLLLGGPGKSATSSGSSNGGRRSKSTSKSTTGSTRRKSPRGDS